MIEFGSRLKQLRLNHNMTQPALAKKLQVTKSVISAYETGLRMPSYETLLRFLKSFRYQRIIFWVMLPEKQKR